MFKAVKAARARSIPIVLDPVGAGATKFRTDVAWRLAQEAGIAVIRGNGSEIMALAGRSSTTRGVDSSLASEDAFEAAFEFAAALGAVVAVTGREDFITDGTRVARITNGHRLMGRVTGTGCSASSITGAFCAVEVDPFVAASGALITFGIAGEMAAATSPGPGTFGTLLLDALDAVTSDDIKGRARVTISALA
jgi:hydroxyethylthiazole kinase